MRTGTLRNFGLSGFLFLLTALGPQAAQQDIYKSIESAIAVGSAERLSEYLNSSVELELPGQEEGIFSKSQTIIVLKKFFDSNPPSSFNFTHKGSSGAGLRYAIGNYISTDETSFRVKIFMKKVGNDYLIQEMEFE